MKFMEEITIPLDNNSNSGNSNPNDIKKDSNLPQEKEQILDLLRKTSNGGGTPSQSEFKPTDKKRGGINIFLFFTTIIFLATTIALAYLYYTEKNQKKIISNNDPVEENGDVQGVEIEEYGIVYLKNNKIYSLNSEGSDLIYSTTENSKINKIFPKDNLSIIFTECIDSKCSINELTISTKNFKNIFDTEGKVDEVEFVEKDKYLFSVLTENSIIINKFESDKISELKILDFPEVEREKFVEDFSDIKISPDKKSFIFVKTNSDSGFNFTSYVLDLNGEVIDEIFDATMPEWIDKNTIVFRKYSNSEAGYLYTRDITKKETELLSSTSVSAYSPIFFDNNIYYWTTEDTGILYQYNLTNKKSEELLAGSYPMINKLGNLITFSLSNCDKCVGTDNFNITDYEIKGLKIYDFSSKKIEEIKLEGVQDLVVVE